MVVTKGCSNRPRGQPAWSFQSLGSPIAFSPEEKKKKKVSCTQARADAVESSGRPMRVCAACVKALIGLRFSLKSLGVWEAKVVGL